jgi:hypothetical protein
MARVKWFSEQEGVRVQASPAYGMDGVVWMTGVEGAILLAMDHPGALGNLV